MVKPDDMCNVISVCLEISLGLYVLSSYCPLNFSKWETDPVGSCMYSKRLTLQCLYMRINNCACETLSVRCSVMLILPVLQGGECSDKVTGSDNKHHLRGHFMSLHHVQLWSGEDPMLCDAQ